MPHRTRFAGGLILVALGVSLAAGRREARADYPDYAPAPPSAEQAREPGRPAELRRPGESGRPGDAPRELRKSNEPRPAGESASGPRQVPVRFQSDDYEDPATTHAAPAKPLPAQPAPAAQPHEALPVVAIKEEPQKLADAPASIPLTPESPATRSLWRNSELPPWMAGAGSLGIVLGLFLLVAWVVRRGMPKNVAILPREAVEVLGRVPLFGREQVYLIRCGNKVVLVAVCAGKLETLTEITDPAEVDRLAGLGQQLNPQSASASFRQVFQQFSQQPARRTYMSRSRSGEMDFGELDDVDHYAAGESRV